MATSPTRETMMFKSSDNKVFVVSESVLLQSQSLRKTMEEKGPNYTVTIPDVNSTILEKVIEFCERHRDDANIPRLGSSQKAELEKWDHQFLSVDVSTSLQLIDAARILGIRKLWDAIVEHI